MSTRDLKVNKERRLDSKKAVTNNKDYSISHKTTHASITIKAKSLILNQKKVNQKKIKLTIKLCFLVGNVDKKCSFLFKSKMLWTLTSISRTQVRYSGRHSCLHLMRIRMNSTTSILVKDQ